MMSMYVWGRGGSGGFDKRKPREEIYGGQCRAVEVNLALFPADT